MLQRWIFQVVDDQISRFKVIFILCCNFHVYTPVPWHRQNIYFNLLSWKWACFILGLPFHILSDSSLRKMRFGHTLPACCSFTSYCLRFPSRWQQLNSWIITKRKVIYFHFETDDARSRQAAAGARNILMKEFTTLVELRFNLTSLIYPWRSEEKKFLSHYLRKKLVRPFRL